MLPLISVVSSFLVSQLCWLISHQEPRCELTFWASWVTGRVLGTLLLSYPQSDFFLDLPHVAYMSWPEVKLKHTNIYIWHWYQFLFSSNQQHKPQGSYLNSSRKGSDSFTILPIADFSTSDLNICWGRLASTMRNDYSESAIVQVISSNPDTPRDK
jgi:hypothetical protein